MARRVSGPGRHTGAKPGLLLPGQVCPGLLGPHGHLSPALPVLEPSPARPCPRSAGRLQAVKRSETPARAPRGIPSTRPQPRPQRLVPPPLPTPPRPGTSMVADPVSRRTQGTEVSGPRFPLPSAAFPEDFAAAPSLPARQPWLWSAGECRSAIRPHRARRRRWWGLCRAGCDGGGPRSPPGARRTLLCGPTLGWEPGWGISGIGLFGLVGSEGRSSLMGGAAWSGAGAAGEPLGAGLGPLGWGVLG